MKHILLINPWIHDFTAFDLWLKPLGLLYIGALLKSSGFNISLIDCMDRNHPSVITEKNNKNFGTGFFRSEEITKPDVYRSVPRKYKRFGIPVNAFQENIKKIPSPDAIIMTSSMTYWYPGVFKAIEECKKVFPKIPVLLGGTYACLCKEHAQKFSNADYVLTENSPQFILKQIIKICGAATTPQATLSHFAQIPRPAYELYEHLDSIAATTSFGCPYACTYCASKLLHPEFHERNLQSIVKELSYYKNNFKVNDIAFYDDALLVNPEKRFIPLARKIIKNNYNFCFHTPNGLHASAINTKIANLMFNTGFKTIRLSFESTSDRIQKASSNKITNQKFKTAVINLKNAGFTKNELGTYLLVGLPGQTLAEVKDAVNFVHDCGVKINLAQFSPIPGTGAFKEAAKANPDLIKEPLLHNNTVYTLLNNTDFNLDTLNKIKLLAKL